jgi:hypothetical protein
MAILCPLCLREVTPGEQFLVYCTQHGAAIPPVHYEGKAEDLEALRCPAGGECNEQADIWKGIFLAHDGCRVKNPMTADTDRMVELPDGKRVEVNTPETRLQLAAGAVYPGQSAMWFPLSLFRAINLPDNPGKLVMLAGPREVGKTIVATMAMSPELYTEANTRKLSRYWPKTYVSVGQLGGGDSQATSHRASFLQAVNAVSRLQSREPGAAFVAPTGREDAYLRAVFLTGSEPKAEPKVWTRMVDVFRQIGRTAAGKSEPDPGATPPTVALLDWAGERFWQTDDRRVTEVASNVDVIALVIDATHLALFGRDVKQADTQITPNSIRHACERLALATHRTRMCLVVTKLDAIPAERRGARANKYLDALERSEDGKLDRQAHKALREWLEQGKKAGAPYEGRLLDFLDEHPKLPVFFISTKNLNGQMLGTVDGMPRSVGLLRFVLWVLGYVSED